MRKPDVVVPEGVERALRNSHVHSDVCLTCNMLRRAIAAAIKEAQLYLAGTLEEAQIEITRLARLLEQVTIGRDDMRTLLLRHHAVRTAKEWGQSCQICAEADAKEDK